jgi:hypothetical protein
LFDDKGVYDERLAAHLYMILSMLQGRKLDVKKAYAVHNQTLKDSFDAMRLTYKNRVKDNGALFQSTNWQNKDPNGLRSFVANHLRSFIGQCGWNIPGDHAPVIPAVHATREDAAWSIAKLGFATVGALDAGWFGKGIYFTSYPEYASFAYCLDPAEAILVIALVTPCNAYPVIEDPNGPESLKGTKLRAPHYQSHYALVQSGSKSGYPISSQAPGTFFDELVVDQEAMVLPAYVIVVDKNSITTALAKVDEARLASYQDAKYTGLELASGLKELDTNFSDNDMIPLSDDIPYTKL